MRITIVARVTRHGAKRDCAWRFTEYTYDTKDKKIRFVQPLTGTFFPNKFNYQHAAKMVAEWEKQEVIVVNGRPTVEKIKKALGI